MLVVVALSCLPFQFNSLSLSLFTFIRCFWLAFCLSVWLFACLLHKPPHFTIFHTARAICIICLFPFRNSCLINILVRFSLLCMQVKRLKLVFNRARARAVFRGGHIKAISYLRSISLFFLLFFCLDNSLWNWQLLIAVFIVQCVYANHVPIRKVFGIHNLCINFDRKNLMGVSIQCKTAQLDFCGDGSGGVLENDLGHLDSRTFFKIVCVQIKRNRVNEWKKCERMEFLTCEMLWMKWNLFSSFSGENDFSHNLTLAFSITQISM